MSTGLKACLPYIQFKFDLNWLKNPEFFTLVEKIWIKPCRAKSALDKIQQKLKLVKHFFKGWGFNLQGELRKQRKEFQEELANLEGIEETIGLTNSQIDRKAWLLCENFKSLDQEEVYWYERSHETWLLQGYNNTAFFHRCANRRKRKNNILSLEKDGQIIEGDDNILDHASDYYSDLFGPSAEYEIQIDPNLWDDAPKVNEADNRLLCRPFSEQEIKDALWLMEKKQGSRP